MNGGYFLIDCKGLDLTKGSTPQIIAGMYAKLSEALASNKPVYAVNCVWGSGVPASPINVLIVPFDGYTIATASTLQVIVTDEDSITINNLIS